MFGGKKYKYIMFPCTYTTKKLCTGILTKYTGTKFGMRYKCLLHALNCEYTVVYLIYAILHQQGLCLAIYLHGYHRPCLI